jgi:hypothetical protein
VLVTIRGRCCTLLLYRPAPVSLLNPARCAVWARRPFAFRRSRLAVRLINFKRGSMLSYVQSRELSRPRLGAAEAAAFGGEAEEGGGTAEGLPDGLTC